MEQKVFFISGIDTGVGKTYATGLLARAIAKRGYSVITQKMVQTGNTDLSEDIEKHRELMGISLNDDDKAGTTCPYVFSYPCSPHMAAERDGKEIDLSYINTKTDLLKNSYDYVLLEGAGGLMVPLSYDKLTIDFIREMHYPLILVTSGKLGSINHTLLSLYACHQQGIKVAAVIYNLYPQTDKEIEENTLVYLRRHLLHNCPDTELIELPEYLGEEYFSNVDLSFLLA